MPGLSRCVVVVPQDCVGETVGLLDAHERDQVVVVPGGSERTHSVRAGLAELTDERYVLIHDAARCLSPFDVFDRVLSRVKQGAEAVVPGVAVADTIKTVDADGIVVGTPDRTMLRAIQTPQGFTRAVIDAAHAASVPATDDAGLVEQLGLPVHVVDGHELGFKITVAADLERAERIVARDPGRGLPRSGGEAGGRSGVPQAQAQAQAPFACDEREERA